MPHQFAHRAVVPRPPLDLGPAAIGLVTVVVANVLYLTGLPLILDPMLSMEPFYISMAGRPLLSLLAVDPAWGPLYALWLKPFVALLGDPVAVYTANLYCLSFGVTVLIYVYLLLLTRRAAVAVGAALFFLVCDFNVPLASKVSGFALLVVLAGFTLSELMPAGARRMTTAAAGVLVASYARPELYPAALCLCAAAIWLGYGELADSDIGVRLWPAGNLTSILILTLWPGTPLLNPYHSGDRLLMAFREHFAWNWMRWHNQGRFFSSIWEQEFGGAQTTLQALLANPVAIAHHLFDNLLGTVMFLIGSAFDHYPLLVPATSPALAKAESVLVAAAVLGSLFIAVRRSALREQMRERYGHALFSYAVVAAFPVASATAIFPLPHYLAIASVLVLLAGALAAALIIPAPAGSSLRTGVLAGLVCLIAVPRPFVLPSAYETEGSPFKARIAVSRTVVDTVTLVRSFVRSLDRSGPMHVLTITDGIGEMLGAGFQEVKVWQKGAQPLEEYMHDNDVGMIISLEPGQDSFTVNDPFWKVLRFDTEAAGYIRLPVPNHETVTVYVRADLVQTRDGSAPPERPDALR